ncbi:MAG: transglycosylase SLT domain-containing protein [Bacteriovoracaceae bacterium]|jgi:hypothetical protein|nr:transglycosylase SLT domain-containing protein [Bacteriovoracaceae bacterium]
MSKKKFSIKIKKPKKSLMCPVGYHVVKAHPRVCKNGTKTWVDEHIRKNRAKYRMFLSENLNYLYWNNKITFKKLNAIKGFPGYHELDSIISFWTTYWFGKYKVKIDPLLVKTIIAIESSFNPKADPKSAKSSAYGLMQVVNKTRNDLRNPKEKSVSPDFLSVTRKDLEDPVLNIAVGVRWLRVKYFAYKRKKGNHTYNMVKGYYSFNKSGDEYAKKVFDLYNKSK